MTFIFTLRSVCFYTLNLSTIVEATRRDLTLTNFYDKFEFFSFFLFILFTLAATSYSFFLWSSFFFIHIILLFSFLPFFSFCKPSYLRPLCSHTHTHSPWSFYHLLECIKANAPVAYFLVEVFFFLSKTYLQYQNKYPHCNIDKSI